MYNQQPYYIEEGKKSEKGKLIIFAIAVIAVTAGIIGLTVVTTLKMLDGNTNPVDEQPMTGDRTTGVEGGGEDELNVLARPNEEIIEEPIETPEPTPEANKHVSKFPKHDFVAAMASQSPQFSDAIAQKVIDVYFEETKKVYLTFDDGPTGLTPAVLDILNRYGVKATFFVLGVNVDNNPELTRRIYEEGHFIANHGYSHRYDSIYASPQNVVDEYNQTLMAIRNAIGNPTYDPHLFRFPGGSSGGSYASVKQEAIDLLRQNSVTYTNWNCLSGDAEGAETIEEMWDYINETAAGDDNLVILMHDASDKQKTVEFLPQLIEKYQNEGYEFCTYYDVMRE